MSRLEQVLLTGAVAPGKKPDDTQPSGFQFSSVEDASELHDEVRLEHQILAIPRDRELLT